MIRSCVLAIGFLCCAVGVTHAAAKYAAPALGVKKCVWEFDAGQPAATKNKTGGYDVTVTGKYNYDDTWTFNKLVINLESVPTGGGAGTTLQTWTCTNESSLATPGTFSVSFNNVAPPGQNNILWVSGTFTATQQGQPNQNYTTGGPVIIRP